MIKQDRPPRKLSEGEAHFEDQPRTKGLPEASPPIDKDKIAERLSKGTGSPSRNYMKNLH